MHLPGLTRLDDETHAGAGLFLDEMMMDRADEQQRGDRGQLRRGVPVGQHDDLGAFLDGVVDLPRRRRRGPRPGPGPARLARTGKSPSTAKVRHPGWVPSSLM